MAEEITAGVGVTHAHERIHVYTVDPFTIIVYSCLMQDEVNQVMTTVGFIVAVSTCIKLLLVKTC